MRITVITDENICRVNEEVLNNARTAAKPQNGRLQNTVLVIVPDRFTLQAEKILMTDTMCLLNIRILTFSMLYNLVYEELGDTEKVKVLDKTAAVLFMWRAVRSVRADLTFFMRSVDQYAFAEKMFNTVNQLASCMADFENLEKNAAADVTRRKMHDIQIIYAKYKELIKEYTDSSGMLGWLIDNAAKSKILKDAKVFITGFEHLSVQRAEVMRLLARSAGDFTAGARKDSELGGLLDEVRFSMQ